MLYEIRCYEINEVAKVIYTNQVIEISGRKYFKICEHITFYLTSYEFLGI